jgi:hypothetical protein
MVNKIDFANVLSLEIERLEDIIGIIKEEIKHREDPRMIAHTANALDLIQNKKAIWELKAQLRSKEDFLVKLKEKSLVDTSELEADFEKLEKEVAEDKEKAEKFINDPKANHSMKLTLIYTIGELDHWMGMPVEEQSRVEASVYYWKCLRSYLEEIE